MSLLENIVPEKYQATEEEKKQRAALCASCHVRKGKTCGKFMVGSNVWSKIKQKFIQTCGCIISEKIVLKSESCQLGKW